MADCTCRYLWRQQFHGYLMYTCELRGGKFKSQSYLLRILIYMINDSSGLNYLTFYT